MSEERQLHLFKGKRQRGLKLRGPSEFQIHCAVADYLRHGLSPGWIWMHPPNGGERPAYYTARGTRVSPEGGKLRRMGTKPGASDILLHKAPYAQLHALELKARGEKLREDQELWQQTVVAVGGQVAVADSVELALSILYGWGAIRKNPL